MNTSPSRNIDLDEALAASEERYAAANPESGRLYAQSCRFLPGGNTRSVIFYSPFPLTLVKGEGARLTDADGHVYADFLGEYSAGIYGHSNPKIREAIHRALDSGVVLGGPNPYEGRLAEALCARFPSLDLVRFCNSGTEANLYALCAASAVTGRRRVLVFDGAYHGGAFYYAGGGSPMNAPFETLIGSYNDLEATRALVTAHAAELAAILVEPMMGSGGGIPADREFLEMLREESSRHGIVLIFDEVMTSRLSPGGLQAKLGVVPDMTTFGKYLGGGMTFGAFGGKESIMSRFDPRHADAFPHSGTYNNNVLTMTAGYVGLTEVLSDEALVELNARGDALRERLNETARRRGVAMQATGVGSILCLHLHDRPVRRPADNAGADPRARAIFHLEMLQRGFYMARRGYMSLSLPLAAADYDGLVEAVDEVIALHGDLLTGHASP